MGALETPCVAKISGDHHRTYAVCVCAFNAPAETGRVEDSIFGAPAPSDELLAIHATRTALPSPLPFNDGRLRRSNQPARALTGECGARHRNHCLQCAASVVVVVMLSCHFPISPAGHRRVRARAHVRQQRVLECECVRVYGSLDIADQKPPQVSGTMRPSVISRLPQRRPGRLLWQI